jgi:CRP-like cAMP-binding protein
MDIDSIQKIIGNSGITAELRDTEVGAIAQLFEVRKYKAGDVILAPGNTDLQDALLILGEGSTEAKSPSGTVLGCLKPGDLAGIISFVGGDVSQISAVVVAKTDCKILFLPRAKFEKLLPTKPAIAYYLMRGIVRSVHGIARQMDKKSEEMKSHLYGQMGLY